MFEESYLICKSIASQIKTPKGFPSREDICEEGLGGDGGTTDCDKKSISETIKESKERMKTTKLRKNSTSE